MEKACNQMQNPPFLPAFLISLASLDSFSPGEAIDEQTPVQQPYKLEFDFSKKVVGKTKQMCYHKKKE